MLDENEKKYLSVLGEKYPTKAAACAEAVSLAAELYLPKGTEHFLSDLHGEYEAFSHIRKSASGVIRRKLNRLFSKVMTEEEISELASIIYYPEEKLAVAGKDESGYSLTISALIKTLCDISAKYTEKKVTEALSVCGEYKSVIRELLFNGSDEVRKSHTQNCIKTVIRINESDKFISALAAAIRRLTVDRVHIVGDIYDRGPRADKIIDQLMSEPSVDIQWGNHDILWIGAAAGSPVCIMTALFNSLTYSNIDFIEIGYGISLRPLAEFAREVYLRTPLDRYMPKGDGSGAVILRDSAELIAAMRKAVSVIMWKLEGETILRNPDFDMEDRLHLEKISGKNIKIGERSYPLLDYCFPTLSEKTPYALSELESPVVRYLTQAFKSSEKLKAHAAFLCRRGGMYKIYNRNLLFHGCIPLDESGNFLPLRAAEGRRGRELMDFCDATVRSAFSEKISAKERQRSLDFIWFLWCGKNSPLSGRERITTFERLLIDDELTHKEPRNPYYLIWNKKELAEMILYEFGLYGERAHIINGHIPVKRGESPIKAGGKLILIDGGFCHAFLERTGIAGYTLIYNSDGMRISAHEPFAGKEQAIKNNVDIASDTAVFETARETIRIISTDEGIEILDRITNLFLLCEAYDTGEIKEGEP